MYRCHKFCFQSPARVQRSPLSTVKCRRVWLPLRARPLSWEIPKHLFPRPETFFPRPERIFDGDTFRDLILKQGEAVKEFPWEYIILFCIAVLIIAELVIKPFDNGGEETPEDSTQPETSLSLGEEETEKETRPASFKDEQEMLYAMKKIHFQEEQNQSLAILAAVAALALWMAGFLNTPHPFYP